MDIEEAKERLKLNLTMTLYNEENAIYKQTIVNVEDVQTVLSELDRLKKYEDLEWQEFNELAVASLELEKKDKVINEMAKEIFDCNEYIDNEFERELNFKTEEQVIEYFTNKVEREGK